MSQQASDVILVRDELEPAGSFPWLSRRLARFEDSCIEAMVRQAELGMAERIARAIRDEAPEGHAACTSWPHCTSCGRAEQARADARTALRTGAGR